MKKNKIICPDCGKKGIKDLNKHKRYCSAATIKPDTIQVENTQDAPNITGSEIKIEPQQESIIQDVKPISVTPEVVHPQKTEKKQEQNKYVVTYEDLANSVHESIARMVRLATGGRISIDDEDIGRLNRAGAGLLQKYDPDGKMLEWSPEIVYIASLIGITTACILQAKQNKEKK